MTEQGKTETLKQQVDELVDYVNGFFSGRTVAAQEKELFDRTRTDTLRDIPRMVETLQQFPHYGAVAFLGKFQFRDCAEVHALKSGGDKAKLKAIRTANAAQLAESARPAWQFLVEHDEDLACTIMALCYVGEQKPQIKRVLK
jgi:hypothetical protein